MSGRSLVPASPGSVRRREDDRRCNYVRAPGRARTDATVATLPEDGQWRRHDTQVLIGAGVRGAMIFVPSIAGRSHQQTSRHQSTTW